MTFKRASPPIFPHPDVAPRPLIPPGWENRQNRLWVLLGHSWLALGVFVVLLLWWPISARLHLKLYANLVRSYQNLNRWKIWNDDSKDWALLVEEQRRLSVELVNLGAGLVLPGDPDWNDPPSGHDDVASVRFRRSQNAV